jgi:hypothetical protein
MRKLVVLSALAVIAVATIGATNTAQATFTGKDEIDKPQTHMGLTAQQWHKKFVTDRKARVKQAGNLGDKVRSLREKVSTLRAVLKQNNGPYSSRPPHYNEWICIHGGEGAWNSNTGNGYYGGLQMDMQFQRTYGWNLLMTKGTANNWTPLEQMWVAEKAWASGRGFYPWPNTARHCGLI